MKHIILLGFKHAGKSTVGRALAEKLQWPFIDLDEQIEKNYQQQMGKTLSCREILTEQGEPLFRNLETAALRQIISLPDAVIALGGGAPLNAVNQALIKPHWLVHITAAPKIVYERMMSHGKPAFFPAEQDPERFFQQLWNQREAIYDHLADLTADNSHSAAQTADFIISKLHGDNP